MHQNTWEQLAIETGFSSRELARRCNVSLRTLQRHFANQYHIALGEWLRTFRLNSARQRIGAGEAIKVVAYDLGYKQLSHFSKAFKDLHGVPPSAVATAPKRRLQQIPRRGPVDFRQTSLSC